MPDAITDVFSLIRYFEGLALKPVPDSRGRVLGWGRNIDVQGWYFSETQYFAAKYPAASWGTLVDSSWTHYVEVHGIDEADAELMLKNDVQDRVGKLAANDWFAAADVGGPLHIAYSSVRPSVIIAMAYQMGAGIFDEKNPHAWLNMMSFIVMGKWTQAAIAGLNSEWGRTQTPHRAWVQCAMLQSGSWPTTDQLKPR